MFWGIKNRYKLNDNGLVQSKFMLYIYYVGSAGYIKKINYTKNSDKLIEKGLV
jgi:hypothetical protein